MSTWSSASVAQAWHKGAVERNRYLAPATDAMFAFARLAPGMRVLDLGTGAGDVAVMAAERVGDGGSVLATDASQAMVQAAASTMREAGVSNVTVRQMDARAIDCDEATFDAVLARMMLMFLDDPTDTLRQVARVLKPGGRLAATTWAGLAHNPYHAALVDVAREHGPLPDPLPEFVRAFHLSEPDVLTRAAEAAGLRDVEVRAVRTERRVSSLEDDVARQKAWPLFDGVFASLDDAQKARAWSEVERRWRAFTGPDGVTRFPSEVLVIGASR